MIEAIWCYETILRDPMAAQDPQIHQAAGLGLGLLLMSEARINEETGRTKRLLTRAISALTATNSIEPPDHLLVLALAEAHVLRFQLTDQPQDLLAANLLLDQFSQTPPTEPAITEKASQLRLLLTKPTAP